MHTSHYRTKLCEITILDNHIIQTRLLEGEIIELEDIIEILDICKRIARKQKHHSLMIAEESSNITGPAREYMMENIDWTESMALVSTSLAHRILFNYTMRKLKHIPYKLHATKYLALKWIEELD